MSKNIEMNYKIDSGYEVIYPNVQTNSVTDISNYYYDKNQVDDLIQESKDYTDGLSFKKNLIVNNASFNLSKSNLLLKPNVDLSNSVGFYVILTNFSPADDDRLTLRTDLIYYGDGTDKIQLYEYDGYNITTGYPSTVHLLIWFCQATGADDSYEGSFALGTSSINNLGGAGKLITNEINSVSLYLENQKSSTKGNITIYSLVY